MTCEEIREKISCMLDNELNAEDSAVVTEHLASCPECLCVFEAFHEMSVALEELEEVPEGFTEAVMQRIKTTATPKRRRRGLLWLAGMAASIAIVLLAGTGISTTHQYVDGSDRDTAQFVNIIPNPKRLPVIVQPTASVAPAVQPIDTTPAPSDAASEQTLFPDVTPVPVEVSAAPETTPTPAPTPRPYIPVWPITTLSDLLLVVEYADYSLHSSAPNYQLTVIDRNGNPVRVSVWLEENRIYCKSSDTLTAWYTIGTPKQLIRLVGAITPTPDEVSPTPDIATPTPDTVSPTPDMVTPTPDVVTPTPDVVTPSPDVVTPTPDTEGEQAVCETVPTPSPDPNEQGGSTASEDKAPEDGAPECTDGEIDGDAVEADPIPETDETAE